MTLKIALAAVVALAATQTQAGGFLPIVSPSCAKNESGCATIYANEEGVTLGDIFPDSGFYTIKMLRSMNDFGESITEDTIVPVSGARIRL